MATTKTKETELQVPTVTTETAHLVVLGKTPLICNRMSQKVKHGLLTGGGKKTASEKASNLKHSPFQEFRDSPYIIEDENAPTLIGLKSTAFKRAMMTAALELPGMKKAQIGRLVWVEGELLPIYGTPKLFMEVTRSADINRTPDVRTRAIIPQWASVVPVTWVTPILRLKSIGHLLGAAGVFIGVGDWRNEKGSGTYGQFEIVASDDPRFKALTKNGGRDAQNIALSEATPYDTETAELLQYFIDEADRRGFREAVTA